MAPHSKVQCFRDDLATFGLLLSVTLQGIPLRVNAPDLSYHVTVQDFVFWDVEMSHPPPLYRAKCLPPDFHLIFPWLFFILKACSFLSYFSFSFYAWVMVLFSQSPKPGPYVKEMNDAATFYTNRVLKDYKHRYVPSFTSQILRCLLFRHLSQSFT